MDFGLRHWARRDRDRVAIASAGRVLTYGELDAQANRIARLFRRLGLRRGDHVAAAILNDPIMYALVWGAYRSGLYFTPIPSVSSAPDVAYVMANATARAVILDSRIDGLIDGVRSLVETDIAWFAIGNRPCAIPSLHDEIAAESPDPAPDENPGALMLYTSGTTGHPKGVWRPLPSDPEAPPTFAGDLITTFGFDRETRYLSTAPLYHAAPLRFSLSVTAAGGTVEMMTKFDAATALDLIEEAEITFSQWVPTMFGRLLALPDERRAAHRAPRHRVALHAAAPCPVPVKRAMIDWWGPILDEYYGGSEGIGMCFLTAEEWLRKPGSVGRCIRGELHILGNDWQELPDGEVGRIYFSGLPPFEYFEAPEKTRERMSPQGYATLGDIGRRDADGYLFLTDRQDDMIISGGVNIYPQELEAAILESPEVEDCAVVGLPDGVYGEKAVAFVVRRPGRVGDREIVAAIEAHCRERLGRVKRPKEIRLIAELPRTPTGKLLRRVLREVTDGPPLEAVT